MAKQFRFDINALRAIAVVAVVLFHFNIPYFQGGFVGVDIFFVISGFLMARIVCTGVLNQQFSLVDFYLSRARRIWPALFVLSTFLLVCCWFVLMTKDYQVLGRHVRESILFTSNIQYFSEAGYFDQASHTKWLLHTWSLSIEWQFYILYPLLILFLYRLTKSYKSLLWLHVSAITLSFIISYLYAITSPSRAFYMLESRAWELLLGGLLFFWSKKPTAKIASLLSYIGFSMLLASIFLIDPTLLWPSPYALLPTVGTFLIIFANVESGFLVKSKTMQWLGDRSYSIYLWHWPLVVLMNYYNISAEQAFFYILLSFALGHLSYEFIELPTRMRLTRLTNKRVLLILLGCVITLATSAQVIRKKEFKNRLTEEVRRIEVMAEDKNPRQKECLKSDASCVFGGPQVSVVLLGDSHADSVVTSLQAALPSAEEGVLMRASSGCLFVKRTKLTKSPSLGCTNLVKDIGGELRRYPRASVVIVNRLPFYLHGKQKRINREAENKPIITMSEGNLVENDIEKLFEPEYLNTVCELAKNNTVYILRTVPEMPFEVPRVMARESLRGSGFESIKMILADYKHRNAFTDQLIDKARKQCGIKTLDPEPYLCDSSFCYGSTDGKALYVDDNHLSEHGNKQLVELFKTIFKSD